MECRVLFTSELKRPRNSNKATHSNILCIKMPGIDLFQLMLCAEEFKRNFLSASSSEARFL